MSNQLKNEIRPTVSHEDMHRLAESETSEQEIAELSNGELEVISGGVVTPPRPTISKTTRIVATGAGLALGVAVSKGVRRVMTGLRKAKR